MSNYTECADSDINEGGAECPDNEMAAAGEECCGGGLLNVGMIPEEPQEAEATGCCGGGCRGGEEEYERA